MKQVLFGSPGAPTGTEYAAVMGSAGWGTEILNRSPWPAPGVLRNLVVDIATAPGVGTSRTFTLRVAGAGTALTVTISDTATTARLTGVDVAVAVGDLVVMQATVTGSPAASGGVRFCLEFEGTTAKESGYSQGIGGTNSTARAAGVFVYSGTTSTTAANARNVVAAAGTLTGMVAAVNTAPGVGNGFTFYINKNGVRQDGSGGTVNTACALVGAITAASATYSLPLVPGDLVYTEAVVSGTFTTRNFGLGASFVATTDGESQFCGVTGGTLSTSLTRFYLVPSGASAAGATETALAVRALGGVSSVVLSGLQVLLNPAPGASASHALTFRRNATSVGPAVTISGTATTGNDLVNAVTLADGDLWNWLVTPAGSPAAAMAHWGLIQYIAPPATTLVGSAVFGVETTVTATRAVAFGLDGETNVHDDAGVMKVFGDVAVTGTITERGRTTPMGAWETYTPTWTNVTVGNGTVTAKYSKVGTTVNFAVLLEFGSTTAITGNAAVVTPTAFAAVAGAVSHGRVMTRDVSAAIYYAGLSVTVSSGVIGLYVQNPNPAAVGMVPITATAPFTWATGDHLFLGGTYDEI